MSACTGSSLSTNTANGGAEPAGRPEGARGGTGEDEEVEEEDELPL